MDHDPLYFEKLQSNRTLELFSLLTILFFSLFIWHMIFADYHPVRLVFAGFSAFFLFYVFNYRTLVIRMNRERLSLKFGVFTWTVPLDNIKDCHRDVIPTAMYYGGAGIHFMLVKGRYRVSFNFLEYPRVVIALRTRQGLVRDVSFTTRQPQEVIDLISGKGKSTP